MTELAHLLRDYQFIRYAVIACFLASIGCGIVGSYIVVKRISFISGGIAHSVLAGMGIAYFLGKSPMVGAIIAAISVAMIIGWIHTKWKQQEDILVAGLWSAGMAIGIIFLAKTPGYSVDLLGYLFGNLLSINYQDLIFMLILDVLIVGVVIFFYWDILSFVFDEEFARVRQKNVERTYYLLLVLIAITVILLVQIVGLVLAICLLSIPAATARLFASSLKYMMFLSCFISLMGSWAGLALSYRPDLPAAPVIVLLICMFYFVSLFFFSSRQKK